MQSYPFNVDNTNGFSTFINAAGDLFVYVKGSTTGASTELSVKSDLGGEIDVIPGQRFRLPTTNGATPTRWTLKAKDGVSPITGKIIIGSGEFDDANTLNVMKLDASFANTVTVTNDAAHPVPITVSAPLPVSIQNSQVEITNDTGNRIPVSLDPTQIPGAAAPIMAYTNYKQFLALAANGVATICTPAENVNGVIIEQVISGRDFSALVAKAGAAPANKNDGELLSLALNSAAAYTTRQKIAAGKGGYIVCSSAGAGDFYVLYTVL